MNWTPQCFLSSAVQVSIGLHIGWSSGEKDVSNAMEASVGACYIMVVHYLERCGDYAVKIGEKIHFMMTGKHIDLDPPWLNVAYNPSHWTIQLGRTNDFSL